MRVPEGDLHCQCKLSIFSLSSFEPCIFFWILQKGTCISKCIFSIFPAVTHQLKCKQTCIEKCRPRHKISMKKWLKIHQISKNVNLFPYITTNLHWIIFLLLIYFVVINNLFSRVLKKWKKKKEEITDKKCVVCFEKYKWGERFCDLFWNMKF